jgi:ElaB/YqjD/DUF883 family membrane-anchored ribosome-binding protein
MTDHQDNDGKWPDAPQVERELEGLKSSLHRLQDAVTPAAHATREAFDATRTAVHQVRSALHETKETLAVKRRIEERPLAALGVSAALGFLLGARRRHGVTFVGKATGAIASIVFMRLADSAVTYATAKLLNDRDEPALPEGRRADGEFIH